MSLVVYFLLFALVVVILLVLYYGTYNHNMSFMVNLFSWFEYVTMKILLGDGDEKDKKRVIAIRKYLIPPRTKLPKVKGIVADVTTVVVRDGTKIDLYTYTPESILNEPESKPHKLIFFCHGGGWVMANRWSNEPILTEYELKTNSVVTYVNYRLAPEFSHPTAVYDCYDTLLFMLQHRKEFHFSEDQIILLGDSAGGMLCCGLVELARKEFNRNIFSKMILIYPAMDSRAVPAGDPSWDERNILYNNTFGLSYKTGSIMSRWYFQSKEKVSSAFGSPVLHDEFENFPPTRFFTVEYDTLKIAARETCEKMRNYGIDVKYECVKGGVHAIWGSKMYDCGINDMVLKELMNSFVCLKL